MKAMKPMYKILLLALFLPLTLLANDNHKKGKYTKSKTINKEFNVNNNSTLNVKNKYGDITISTWNKNLITITVNISTNGNDEKKVEDRLKNITVEFDANTDVVSAITKIEKKSKSWGWWGNDNVSMKINYIIKMPATNNVKLANDYGNIVLDNLSGAAFINCDYGKLDIGRLENEVNNISIDYTKGSNIEYLNRGVINADYSTLHIENSDLVKLNADYSHLSFGKTETLNYNCDYGSLDVENANFVKGRSDYMHAKIERIDLSGNFNSDYGSIKIGSLGNAFKNLQVQTSYTHVKIGVVSTNSFKIEANLSYTNFKTLNGFNFSKEIINGSKKYYQGYFNAPSNAQINIKSSYGSVTFN